MSSRFEGFGMVLIEAMAYGVPCVSFDCKCGPKEIITHGQDGFLVANGDTKAFADHIEQLIVNSDQRKQMGKEARAQVHKYLPDTIVPQWDELFKELVQE